MKIGINRGRKTASKSQAKSTKTAAKKPQSVSIEIEAVDLISGDSVPVSAYVVYDKGNKDQRVQWQSSNESIVMVENGEVKAVNAGKAMIKAMAVADNNINQTMVISVTENHVK